MFETLNIIVLLIGIVFAIKKLSAHGTPSRKHKHA